ncbi:hypothetical protein [Acidovorax phage ACPWH]|nr:hypothetical protein [Acidovorax phage ACPWH]QXV72229.1 hypothetical protein Acf1_00032 [Acidovorax phage ACF1]
MTTTDLDDSDQRADRMLDGMAVNRERLARDTKALTAELRNWRRAHERAESREPEKASDWGSAMDELLRRARRG